MLKNLRVPISEQIQAVLPFATCETLPCTKHKWCRNVQWTLPHQCRYVSGPKCLMFEVSVHHMK